MNEHAPISSTLDDEILEAGPAYRTEIVIPCPPPGTSCKVSDIPDATFR